MMWRATSARPYLSVAVAADCDMRRFPGGVAGDGDLRAPPGDVGVRGAVGRRRALGCAVGGWRALARRRAVGAGGGDGVARWTRGARRWRRQCECEAGAVARVPANDASEARVDPRGRVWQTSLATSSNTL